MLNFFTGKNSSKNRAKRKNPNFITDQNEIFKLFKQVCEKQLPVYLSWEGNQENHPTFLLKTGTEQFILDRLEEDKEHEALLECLAFKAVTNVDGVNMTFNVELSDSSTNNNQAYYLADLPQKVYYPQRRDSFRSIIPAEFPITFKGRFGIDEIELSGELLDLSYNGLGVMLENKAFLRKGDRIRGCSLSGKKGLYIAVDLEVRSVRTCERNTDMLRIGARIIDPNRKTLKQLKKTALELDALNLKRKQEKE